MYLQGARRAMAGYQNRGLSLGFAGLGDDCTDPQSGESVSCSQAGAILTSTGASSSGGGANPPTGTTTVQDPANSYAAGYSDAAQYWGVPTAKLPGATQVPTTTNIGGLAIAGALFGVFVFALAKR